MRIAYLECFSGISGDMFLGALVDAGVPTQVLQETIAALEVSAKLGARLEISRVVRSGISATKVDVYVHGEKDLPREEHWEHEHSHGERHEHEHHSHSHSHGHEVREREHHELAHNFPGEISRAEPALSLSKGVPAPHEHA